MIASDRNIPLSEIGNSARAAARNGEFAACPYNRGSAAAWCFWHIYSAALAQFVVDRAAVIDGGEHV